MGINTKEVGESTGSFISKQINPGNVVAKINKIEIKDNNFGEGAVDVILHLESEPIEGFTGFLKNKDVPSDGNYEGQVGQVKLEQYSFSKINSKTKEPINRDKNILLALKRLCTGLGIQDWYNNIQDDKYNTVEELIQDMDKDKPYEGIYLRWCIAAKEKMKPDGYPRYYCFLPRTKGKQVAFEIPETTPSNLITFDEKIHVIKDKTTQKVVGEFEPTSAKSDLPWEL